MSGRNFATVVSQAGIAVIGNSAPARKNGRIATAGTDAFAVGARVTVPLHDHAATDALAVIEGEQLRASEIATRIPTLDDVYLHLTGERIAA